MNCVSMHSSDMTCGGLTDRRRNLVSVKSKSRPPRQRCMCIRKEPTNQRTNLLSFFAAASGIAPLSTCQEIYLVLGIYSGGKEGGKLFLEIRVPRKAKSIDAIHGNVIFSLRSAELAFSLCKVSGALDCSTFLQSAFSMLFATQPFTP